MIQEIVRSSDNRLVIDIPDEYVGKELNVLIFSDSEVIKRRKDDEIKRLLEEFRKISENPVKIDPNIDIVKLDEDMYDDIF